MRDGFVENDGGRADAGYRGDAGDCVVRAIAIAEARPYREVYDEVHAALHASGKKRSPRNGVPKDVWRPYLLARGWRWTPTVGIATGARVHLDAAELPAGRLIVRLSGHLVAVLDGVIHDTFDPRRPLWVSETGRFRETRCVYGYFHRDETTRRAS